jgi:hypothetical protein
MAKNRKAQSAAVRFGPAVKAFLLCLFIGGSGIGYVWQKNQVHALGQQIKERENLLRELHRRNQVRATQLATLCGPSALEARIRQMNLGLVFPPLSQIVRLTELPAGAPVAAMPPAPAAGELKQVARNQ